MSDSAIRHHRGSAHHRALRFLQSLGEKLSYAQAPRPFKNPAYTKNNGRRAKNVKAVLAQERERARAAAERMAVDGEEPDPDPLNCERIRRGQLKNIF